MARRPDSAHLRALEQIAAVVTESRQLQGLPPVITDPATLQRVARLIAGGGADG